MSEAMAPDELLRLLVDTTVDPAGVGAAAAAALRVDADGRVRIVAAAACLLRSTAWSQEVETLGAELGRSCGGVGRALARGAHFPLVSGRDVYGALVMFSPPPRPSARASGAGGGPGRPGGGGHGPGRPLCRPRALRTSELRASREALAKSEKLRALGEMAAGISHDIKNILNPLALQVELVRGESPSTEQALETWGHMADAIRSGVDVVERLRAFSRQTPESEAEAVDLNQALATAAELFAVPG
jgi:signal transduction histidine kinase